MTRSLQLLGGHDDREALARGDKNDDTVTCSSTTVTIQRSNRRRPAAKLTIPSDASMDALLRPLANHADRNVTIMDNVIICLYSFGTSAIDTDETLERLQTILGPDLEDSTTEALNTAIDMMSYFRGIDDRRVRDFYAAMVAAVPRVCLPNDEEEEEEELEEEGDEEEEEDDTLVDGADGESQETDESDNNGPFIALGQQDDISSLGSRSREPWPIRNNERVAAALNDDASDAEDEGTSSAFDVDGQQSI